MPADESMCAMPDRVLVVASQERGQHVEGGLADEHDGGAGGRALPRPAGTAAIGAVVHLLAAAIEEGRGLSSMSGILAETA
ncbi:hypothetical protein [Streptomyces sp. NPDC059970]|uniref:hypothetical protein n=1 Tax=Streptomyces sp. NPDC059970 TaxID=3347019 RepID=UPI00368ED433